MKTRKPAATVNKDKFTVDLSTAWVTWVEVGYGIRLYALFTRGHVAPIGIVWGVPKAHSFDVYQSFVIPNCRRQGVRTRINKAIFEHHAVITTGGGTRDGGMAFLKAQGYKLDKQMGTWSLARPAKSKK